jgi:hypothetical protein
LRIAVRDGERPRRADRVRDLVHVELVGTLREVALVARVGEEHATADGVAGDRSDQDQQGERPSIVSAERDERRLEVEGGARVGRSFG